jgi:hypothetical protein
MLAKRLRIVRYTKPENANSALGIKLLQKLRVRVAKVLPLIQQLNTSTAQEEAAAIPLGL